MQDVGVASAQNRRAHMEDAVHVEPSFAGRGDGLYVGVFDGHGGATVSRLAADRLHGLLAAELTAGRPLPEAIPHAFRAFDDSVAREPCGSTAAIAVLLGREVTVANAGDSHVVLVAARHATVLTTEHRLTNEAEYRRVVAAGARIEGRYACLPAGDGLECTRALGDRAFRTIGIHPNPDVVTHTLTMEDAWLVAATDGVWDALEVEEVAAIVRRAVTARLAAEAVRDAALAAGTDNVTAVVVRLSEREPI